MTLALYRRVLILRVKTYVPPPASPQQSFPTASTSLTPSSVPHILSASLPLILVLACILRLWRGRHYHDSSHRPPHLLSKNRTEQQLYFSLVAPLDSFLFPTPAKSSQVPSVIETRCSCERLFSPPFPFPSPA